MACCMCPLQLLLHGRKQERDTANLAIVEFLKPGVKIRAMYADEDHEPAVRFILHFVRLGSNCGKCTITLVY